MHFEKNEPMWMLFYSSMKVASFVVTEGQNNYPIWTKPYLLGRKGISEKGGKG